MVLPGFAVGPRVTTSDGVSIATYDLGGDGPPLLLAHAAGFHARMWLPAAPHLRARYHCIAFDARGHGESGKAPDHRYDWEGFALDAEAVLEGLGLRRPCALGHSMGGAVLLLVEEATPGTFDSLYCYEPVVFADRSLGVRSQRLLADMTRRRRECFSSRQEALANYTAKPPFSRFDAAAADAYVTWGFEDVDDGTVRLRCRREDEACTYEMGPYTTVFDHLERVACPVTVACGGDGAHFDPATIESLAGRIPNGRTEVIPGLSHFGPYERPELVAAAVMAALDPSPRIAPPADP